MPSSQQNLIGPQVRRTRMAVGLTQDDLATKLQVAGWDISRAGLSKIESRLRRVTDAELYLLAKVLGCDLTSLFPIKVSGLKGVLRHGYD